MEDLIFERRKSEIERVRNGITKALKSMKPFIEGNIKKRKKREPCNGKCDSCERWLC